jgi:hypothetical protein
VALKRAVGGKCQQVKLINYSLTFPPFFFTFVAKSIFLLSDIMATTDFLLKQATTNNRHVHTHKNSSQSPLDYIASLLA